MKPKSYQIVQERYEAGSDYPTQDEYPILFSSIEEARARVVSQGLPSMFEHEGGSIYIAELEQYRDGVSYTGRTFELEC